MNIKEIIGANNISPNSAETSWDELANEIGKSIEEMKTGLEEIQSFQEQAGTSTDELATSTADGLPMSNDGDTASSSVRASSTISEEKINLLKKKLQDNIE